MRILKVCLIMSLAAVLSGFWGCDNKPTKPPPHEPEYYLLVNYGYYADSDSLYFDLVYSTKTDSIVDSFYLGEEYSSYALFSHDANTTYHTNLHDQIIYSLDWRTGETLAVYNDYGGSRLSISEGEDYLLLTEFFQTVLLQLPDMTTSNIFPGGKGQIIPNRNIFCTHWNGQDSLIYYDYSQADITRKAIAFRDNTNAVFEIQAFTTSQSGDSLLIIGNNQARDQWFVFIAEFESLNIHAKIGIPLHDYWQGHIIKHPDKDIVYFYYPGATFYPPVNGFVYSLDLKTEELLIVYDASIHQYSHPRDLAITPDGKFLYVLDKGIIFKYDIASHELKNIGGNREISGLSISICKFELSEK